MRRFLSFWWCCAKRAFQGNAAFANDWQWLFGIPILSGAAWFIAAKQGATEITTGSPILDGIFTALGAFIITWTVAFFVRFFDAPAALHEEQRVRADNLARRLQPKLKIFFDPADRICLHDTFLNSNESNRIIYVAVVPMAITDATISNCRGWLVDVQRLAPDGKTWEPTSFAKSRQELEWGAIGFEPVAINPGMRQALNVFRVQPPHNRVFPCVSSLLNKDAHLFDDPKDIFRFEVAVTGDDCPIATCSLRLEVDQAGNLPKVEIISAQTGVGGDARLP